jgi:hypothetical protein
VQAAIMREISTPSSISPVSRIDREGGIRPEDERGGRKSGPADPVSLELKLQTCPSSNDGDQSVRTHMAICNFFLPAAILAFRVGHSRGAAFETLW